MKTVFLTLTIWSLGFLFANGQTNSVSDDFKAGVGIVDISGDGAVILDPLHVKTILFRQGEEQIALVECDVTGIPDEVISSARTMVASQTNIPYQNVCVAATHTHMSKPHKDLVPAIVKAVKEAIANLRPARLLSATGQEFTEPRNRRYFMKNGTVEFNPMFLNPDIVRPAGPIDPDVGFILIRDASSNSPLVSLTNYALHPDIVKEYGAVYQKDGIGSRNSVSADYPYWVETNLKREFGESFNSIFLTGCCGNINHWDFSKPGPQSGHDTKAKEVGDSLYHAIKRVLPKLKENTPTLAIRSQIVSVPLQSFTDEHLKWAQNVNNDELSAKSEEPSERQQFLESVRKRRILWLNKQKQKGITSFPLEIHVIRLNKNTAIVTLPGEMFVEHGQMIKNFSPFENTLIVELTNSNDVNYVPNKTAFKQGGYEVENSRLAPGGGEMLDKMAIKMLNDLKY
tara:strand:- start:7453 stop:8820 length:1368 start_codon:yes stop_codon:yes gene_type:complete